MKFVCKSFYEIVCNYKIYHEHQELSEQIICKTSVSNSFRKTFFTVLFQSDIFLKFFYEIYVWKFVKGISSTNALSHLLCCLRFNKFNKRACRSCSLAWVKDAKYFCGSVCYYLGCNTNRVFSRDVKALFIENHKVLIRLKGVHNFRNYSSEVKDLHQCRY